MLVLAIYLFCKGKRRRRSRAPGATIDDDYLFIGGSPRHSGEEADPFLVQRPGGGGGGTQTTEKTVGGGSSTQYAEMGARPPQPPPKNVPRVPPPPATTVTSLGSSNSSSTNSGYGEPLAQPTLGIRPIREEHEQEMSGGTILSPEELQRLDQETVLPPEEQQEPNGGQYSGAYAYRVETLLPPPKLVDPASRNSADFTLPRPFAKKPSQSSQRSSLPLDVDENATLLTARRVRVEDLGPRSSPGSSPVTDEANTSKPSTSSFLGSLGAIAGRLSWRRSQSPRSSQQQPLLGSSPLSDRDIEQGRQPRPPVPQMRETTSARPTMNVGLGPDGSRPISSVSGKSQNSGGTIYHDALSSLPGTPTSALQPRAATPSDVTSALLPPPASAVRSRPSLPSQLSQSHTVPYDQSPPSQAGSPPGASYAHTLSPGFDILDLPAPSAIFNTGSNPSLQASSVSDATIVNRNTGNNGYPSVRTYPFPPGLDAIPQPKAWSEMSNEDTPSPGSYGVDQENGAGIDITIDVLEEEPPAAGEGWRSMAAATSTGGGDGERIARRTTFGLPTYVPGLDLTSEQGSLHSMRSHVSPASPPRSTGSAAASTRRELSYGSNSSRPSAHSAARSTGTGGSAALSFAQSLARSGSITSDGRKRGHGPISPALSVFGNKLRDGSGSGSGSGSGYGSEFAVSREGSGSGSAGSEGVVLQSPSTAYLGPEKATNTTPSAMSSPPLMPLNMPWAGGLEDNWSPSS